MNPLVSVVVAVHDGATYLDEALTSISEQDYRPLEVFVIDDGSTDGSAQIAGDARIGVVVSTSCQGVAGARNLGLSLATGEFITFLDHDDVWLPQKTSQQVRHLQDHPATGCVLGRQEIFVEGGHEPPPWMTRDRLYGDLDGIPLVSAMFRIEALLAIEGYDPSYAIAEDRDLFVRLRASGCRIDVLPEVVLRRRFHDANRSHQSHRNGHALLRSLKTKVDRERLDERSRSDA